MVSFQQRLATGLERRGLAVCYDLADLPYVAILVVGGTRQLSGLWRARRRGVPIVQRLDGMNWLHRLQPTSLRHRLRAEYGNTLLALIRSRLTDSIIYQSEFARRWWERVRGPSRVPNKVIYNSVDLEIFSPAGVHGRPIDHYRLLIVEGSLMGGYELGLETAEAMGASLAERLKESGRQVELVVVGRVAPQVSERWEGRSRLSLRWMGQVPPERIPEIDRSAHLLYSADLNAACPNSVIEAMACGLPVVAFDTGALPELVTGGAGRVVPYGGDPWRLDPPDVAALAEAALEVLVDQDSYRLAARRRAEAMFGLDEMVDGYLQVLLAG
jgi:glycosyltransferase involved in cell wall biosynthesis